MRGVVRVHRGGGFPGVKAACIVRAHDCVLRERVRCALLFLRLLSPTRSLFLRLLSPTRSATVSPAGQVN